MSYNGGLEDPQSWPFSVRYTASPYRKSKFPVDATGKPNATTRDNIVNLPSTDVPSSSSSANSTTMSQHYPHQYQSSSSQAHWMPNTDNPTIDTTVTSGSYRHNELVQNTPSSLISPGGAINRASSANNNISSTVTTITASSQAQQQLGALPFPLHHQTNQPLFAQALVNYHNTQNNSNNSNGSSNFRQYLHNSNSQHHHPHYQRQLQFQKGTFPIATSTSAASAAGVASRLNSLALETTAPHLHQLHQYQNHERQRFLQQRLLLNSSNATGAHLHPFLSGGVNSGGVKNGTSSNHPPDHNHYGLPISSNGSQQQPVGLLGAQLLSRSNNHAGGSQHLRQGNAVWHLLTDNKDLDQVEGLDEGYIEDLKQPFLFHHHSQSQQHPSLITSQQPQSLPHHSQINSIKPTGVLNLQQQQTTGPFSTSQPFQGPTSSSSGAAVGPDFQSHGRTRPSMVFGAPPSADPTNANSLDYDPYSYVYDSHLQQDDLMLRTGGVDLRSLNAFGAVGDHHLSHGFNGTEFPNKILLAQTLSNTSSLQGLPPSLRTGFGGAPTATTNGGSSDEDVSENEYEEIQEVARYMNSASLMGTENNIGNNSDLLVTNGKKGGSINSSSSPDDNYEYDTVHPNYDDVGLVPGNGASDSMNIISGSATGGGPSGGDTSTNTRTEGDTVTNSPTSGGTNGNCNESNSSSVNNNQISNNNNNTSRRSPAPPIGPPRHFKSFSSTDDILAEVVQVQQKHDRVLDQLNLEVENLLIRSTKQEIEENELNCQRSHNNSTMIMLRNAHSHYHQQQGDLMNPCLGTNCYCNQNQGSGSGSCQQPNVQHLQQQQMCSGTTISSLSGTSSEITNMLNNMNMSSSGKGEGPLVSNNEGGVGEVNNIIGSSSANGSCNCCCCCGCCSSSSAGDNANGNPSAVASSSSGVKDKSTWRETLKASLLSGFHNHGQHHHHHLGQSHHSSSGCAMGNIITGGTDASSKLINGNSSSVACIAGLGASNGTFSRKKKLDRNAPGQLSDTNLKHKLNTLSAIQSHNEQFQLLKKEQHYQNCSSSCTALCVEDCGIKGKAKNMDVLHTLNHHILHGGKGGGWKGRYQRSNSLIPSWKIRDHLMRLPFLRQNKDKLKKGDGVTGSSCSTLHTSKAASGGVGSAATNSTSNGGGTSIPKSISGVDFSSHPPSSSSALLLEGYNKNQHHHHHHHQHPLLLHYSGSNNGNHGVSSCIAYSHQHHQKNNQNIMSGNGTTEASNAVSSTTTCSSVNNNPNLKLVRSSSMDELRPTEEHWYSADSDTEPDSLTAIIPPPPQSGSSNNIDNCCGTTNSNTGNNPSSVSSSSSAAGGDLSVTVIDQAQKNVNGGICCSGSCCANNNGDSGLCSGGSSSSSGSASGNAVGNIYTNSPNGVNSGHSSSGGNCVSTINGCGGGVVVGGGIGTLPGVSENGSSRMDVVSSTIIPDAPKAPKFRRGTQGLKDKWRESWSHSKTLSKNNMEEENRLLRWFSLRKNSTTLDASSTHSTNNRHSTLPQLTEEDLKRISFMEDEEGYWPRRTVQPPSLPPPPPDLSSDQITRRHIIAAIVHSENSYVAALQRLVNEYKKPLECSHPAMLSHSKISAIFHRVPEILQCHSLFRIALAECVRRWDSEEKIGDVFVASFSKSLVLDVYSEFINNFGTAMETAKLEARRKSAFAEFLKVKQMTAHDRLSLFGLMVKPVQRFPQFILLLQDLLKHTPRDHHDRMSLQLALTQLESLAAMLNERKRESEQYQAFKETIKSIGGGKFVLLRNSMDDSNRILLRQDVVTQLEFDNNGGTVAKSKCRKLLLLNDMLICTTLPNTSSSSLGDQHNQLNRKDSSGRLGGNEDNSTMTNGSNTNNLNGPSSSTSSGNFNSGKAEKCMFKWSFPVREVEVEDISISPTMSRFVQNASGGNKGSKASPEDTASLILLEEMQSLMHDYEILSRVLTLVQALKSPYEGLSEATIKELMLDIQHQIQRRDEQISYFDSSCLTLLLGSGNNKEKVIFQMQSPQARNEWIEELRLAQLALDPSNSPAWDIPLESPYPLHKLPLFVRASPVCKSPHLTTVKCGCYFTHTFVSQTGRSKILDYLWVSSTDGMSSHITAFRSQQNTLKEVSSFDMVEEKVNDLLFVMGHIWMGTESRKIMVYDPSDPDKGSIGNCLLTDSIIKLTLYNCVIYAGLADGNLAVFTDISSPKKNLMPTTVVKLGPERITSIFGSKDNIYAACGNAVVTIDAKTHTIERSVVLTHHNGPISHMACSGVGLWIATHESGTVCLYHLESLQHLQDVSIAPSVFRTVRDSFRRQKGVHVTCLMAHKGWLWIGTNLGVVLTIPLPRLEGVPIISTGNANVSFHGFVGPVNFLLPLMKPTSLTLPLQQKHHHNAISKHNHHQKEFKESNIKPEVKEDSYIEMSSPASLPPIAPASTKSPEPVVIQSDELGNGELCLSTSKNNTKDNKGERSANVSFNTHDDENIKSIDEVDYPNGTNTTENEDDEKHDSLSSVPSADLSSSSFNPTASPVDGASSAGSDRSSCNSMERGVTPVSAASSPSASVTNSKTLVVLRKKSSKDNVFLRNCKTLPRGGPIPSRFSIESDVYGLYGNLINVRGLEDEGRFVDPLYDALRRSDPELNALDAKISTLDRRLKMRMSRPRSLDLSNWSVDSKISASSDESVGLGSRSSQQTTDSNNTPTANNQVNGRINHSPVPKNVNGETGSDGKAGTTGTNGGNNNSTTNSGTTKKTMSRQKHKSVKGGPQERTVLVVVGGRGYLNMRTQPHPDQFLSSNMESESKSCTHLTLWQMKT